MKPLSLSLRLKLTTLLPVVLVLLLFSSIYVFEAYQTAAAQRLANSEVFLKQLIPLLQFSLTSPHAKHVQALINTGMMNPDIQSINLYQPSGKLMAYHGHPFPFPHFKAHPTIDAVIPLKHGIIIAPIFDTQPLTTQAPHPLLGWVSIQLDPHPELLVLYQHVLVATFLGAVCLLFCWIVHVIFSKDLMVSFARLRRSMKQIMCNEFETKIKVHDTGPLKDLEQGCQYLQKQYLDSVHDLNHHIEIATADLQQSLELLEEKNIDLSLGKKKAEEKNAKQSEFIANMSHEIRTPMNGMLGFTNILMDTSLTPLQRDYVNTIRSSANALLSIINDILDYSKINAGQLQLETIPVDLRQIIDETLTLAAPAAYKKNLFLLALTQANVPNIIIGDPLRIKQILNNLVTNAVKFTEKGEVIVRASIESVLDSHYHLLFQVSDTGIGISVEEQQRLFSAFYQADPTISRRFGGTGLGLVICKKLAEAMSGQIQIESKLHEGTIFTARLQFQKIPAYETEKLTSPVTKKETLLFIDAHPLSLKALEQTCIFLNYQPICITDPNTLQTTLKNHPEIKLIIFNVHHQGATLHHPQLQHLSLPLLVLSNTPLPSLSTMQFLNLLNPIQTQKLNDTIESLLTDPVYFPTHETTLSPLREKLKMLSPHILIAEDNPVNRLLLETLLSPYARLTIANDGGDALNQCEQATFDFLILDLQMPKYSGQAVASLLREQHPAYKHTPILFISANASDISQSTLQQLKIKKCLQKPFDEETLLREILSQLHAIQTPPIDWHTCVKNMSGNQALAQTCMKQFIEELDAHRATLQANFKQQHYQNLAEAAHQLKGACAFLSVPILKQLAHELEEAATAHSTSTIHPLIKQLFHEMDRVYEAYQSLSF